MYAIALIKVKTRLNVDVKMVIESATSTPGYLHVHDGHIKRLGNGQLLTVDKFDACKY
jgi:hypothetical protein